MHLLTTTRHLDREPTDDMVRQLRQFLDTEVVDRAVTREGIRAMAFLLPADRRRLFSFTVWPDEPTMREAEVSAQHLDNSVLIESMLGVTRPREQHHYEVLSSRNLGTSPMA